MLVRAFQTLLNELRAGNVNIEQCTQEATFVKKDQHTLTNNKDPNTRQCMLYYGEEYVLV